jgi:hypothetical protein
MYRRVCFLLMLPASTLFCQSSPTPHAGWKLAAGGENLLVNGYWDNYLQASAPAYLQVSGGVLTTQAFGTNYVSSTNSLAPRLQTKGDFGVIATIQTAPGMNGLITLTGSLPTGSQYWQGMTEIQFGVDNNGNYVFDYWDGSQNGPVSYQTLKGFATPPTGTVTMEMLHQSGQFLVYFNGTQYGAIPDPGLFKLGFMIPGVTVDPGQQMTLTQYAFEVPASDTTEQVYTPIGPIPAVHPGDSLGSLAAIAGRAFGDAASALTFTNGAQPAAGRPIQPTRPTSWEISIC